MTSDRFDADAGRLVRAALDRPLPPVAIGGTLDPEVFATGLQHAASLAAVDQLPQQRRLSAAKRAVTRVARLFLRRQSAFNHQVVDLLGVINHQLAAQGAATDRRIAAISAELVDLQLRLEDALDAARTDMDGLQRRLDTIAEAADTASEFTGGVELQAVHERLQSSEAAMAALAGSTERLLAQLREVGAPDLTPHAVDDTAAVLRRVRDQRYLDFEDELRGSADATTAALSPYLDDVRAVGDLGADVVDIGSGRGAWLRLLRASGVSARGIDRNVDFVDRCVDEGLSVALGDAVDVLGELPEASVAAVTAFHLIEHLGTDVHQPLFDAIMRVLKPGGLLIVETPNPTNVVVGAAAFYRDPSHLRPIHPDYLQFLARESGFVAPELRFLHPCPGFEELGPERPTWRLELNWALFGPQDVALLARRPNDAERD